MSTQDEDDLKLEPPQAQPPAPGQMPAPIPAAEPPAVAGSQPPAHQDPAQGQAAGDLQPGAGKPLVEGPPMSVSEPIDETTINRAAGIAGVGLFGVAAVVVVLVLVVVLFAVCHH